MKLSNIILQFTTNRQYILQMDNITIKNLNFNTTAGIPQGSHIGPLIYLLYCNDLPSYIQNSNTLLYADDTKIYIRIKSDTDRLDLQTDINNMAK